MLRNLQVGIVAVLASTLHAQPLTEQFDDVPNLLNLGWILTNNSSPAGTTGWFQGVPTSFPAQATSGYIAADYRNVNNIGTISNWLILPELTLQNGDVLQFWTRTVSPSVYADRLQVRLSMAGGSVNVGTGPATVGDFQTLLLDINPTYLTGGSGYPTAWTQYTVPISGLPLTLQGRLAFRYFVEQGGENGPRSDYIGIDSVSYSPGGLSEGRCCFALTGQCTVTTALTCGNSGGVFAGVGTNCDGAPCPQPPTGACCLGSGACQVLTSTVCVEAGGLYRGDGTKCGSVACPVAFKYSGEPLEVPDGNGSTGCGVTVLAEVFVPVSFPVERAEAAMIIVHRWQGDLKVTLSKLSGPSAALIDRPGWPQTEYGFSADDYGSLTTTPQRYFRVGPTPSTTYDVPTVVFPGIAGATGSWKAEGPIGSFAGVDSVGRWRLVLNDCAGGNVGELREFTLLLTPPPGVTPCYPNCDGSVGTPTLTANDFQCFLNLFASGDQRANCDASLTIPQLTANDFICFLNQFAGGCP